MPSEFDLVERNGRLTEARAAETRAMLRSAWQVPRDTLICEDMPFLLARLSRITLDTQPEDAEPDNPEGSDEPSPR